MSPNKGEISKVARVSLKLAQLSFLLVIAYHVIPLIRQTYLFWGAPELIWYEAKYAAPPIMTAFVMLIILRLSKTVVATFATVIAIVGIGDFIMFRWPDEMLAYLIWIIPYGLSATCLFVVLFSERQKKQQV